MEKKDRNSCKIGSTLLSTLLFFLLCSTIIQAATMPDLERFQPITTPLKAPTAVALDDSENVYVTESSNNRLLVFSHNGRYLKTIAGLDKPISVAVSSDGRVYAGNKGRGNVEVYNTNSVLLYKLGTGDGEFTQASGIVLDSSGNVYVTDSKADRIKVYNPNGSYKFAFGSSGSKDGQFNFPIAIAIDEQNGEILISDVPLIQSESGPYEGARIQIFDIRGGFKRSFGTYGLGEGTLIRPLGVEVDDEGRIYVTDAYQNVVKVFDNVGAFLGTIYNSNNPLRTPLGLEFSKKTNRLFIVSLNTLSIEVYGIDVRTINASAGKGGIISPSGTVFVKKGKAQTFTITPDIHYDVADVIVDGSSEGAETTYTFTNITTAHSIEVEFIPKPLKRELDTNISSDDHTIISTTGDFDDNRPSFFSKPPFDYLIKHPFISGLLLLIGILSVVLNRRVILDALRKAYRNKG